MKSAPVNHRLAAGFWKRVVAGDSTRWQIAALIFGAAFVFLWRLGATSLADWDEAIYAQVSKEMARDGHWLTPHWNGQPWFEKPPLLMWATGIFYRLFGVSEFWSRAASALSAIGVVVLTYSIGRRVYSRGVGLFAALVLLTSYQFVAAGRFGTTDVMLTLFTYLAVYAYMRLADGEERFWYLLWLGCALALMVKGAAGWVAPVSIALALWLDGSLTAALKSRHFRQALMLALVVVAPWHLLMYVQHGDSFVGEYFGYHLVARATRPLEGHAESYLFYLGRLLDGLFPWCLLLPFAIASAIRESRRGGEINEDARVNGGSLRARVLWLVVVLVFVFYTLIPTKLAWYILPLYPASAILVAAFAGRVYRRRPRIAVAVCILLTLVGVAYCTLLVSTEQRSDEALASLARAAGSTQENDRESLVLFSDAEPLYRPAALFYSNRPLQQAYASDLPPQSSGAKRYYDFEKLSDVTSDSTKRIILRREEAERLRASLYEIRVLAESGSLVYATIKRKE